MDVGGTALVPVVDDVAVLDDGHRLRADASGSQDDAGVQRPHLVEHAVVCGDEDCPVLVDTQPAIDEPSDFRIERRVVRLRFCVPRRVFVL